MFGYSTHAAAIPCATYRSSPDEQEQHNYEPAAQPDLDGGIQIRIDDLTLEELARKMEELGIPTPAREAAVQHERERRKAEGAV